MAKEGLALIIALAAVLAGAVFWPLAPVGEVTDTQAHAPWIFLGLQQILRISNPILGGLVLPCAALCWLGALPWLAKAQGAATPQARRPGWAEWISWAMLAAWIGLTVWGYWA